MRTPVELWRTLRALRRRGELEAGLDDEIRFHIDQQTAKNRRAGMAPEEARRQALITFGALENAKEGVRDEIRMPIVEVLWRDLRYAARALRRAPGFTIVAALTLALGIGATTAMFSVLNGVVLRPLPYPDQDRLVELVHTWRGRFTIAGSPAVYFGYRDHGRVFDAVGLWDWDSSPVTVVGPGDPETVESVEVTHEVLTILGAQPIAGRSFTQVDDLRGSAPTAIISYGYWQRRFGGRNAVGETLIVDGVQRQIIGVLPQWFNFFRHPAEIFYPLQLERSEASFPSGDGRGIARLKEGVTLEQANADVARIIPILDAEYPGGDAQESQFAPNLTRLKDRVVDDLAGSLWLLMGTIALLLTMACANVANLVLVRTHAHAPEFAVRAALGADWTAIARVVWAECALLAIAGGIAGMTIAYVSLPFVLKLGASDLPQIMPVRIDFTVLLVALGASAMSAAVCGVLPLAHMAWPRLPLTRALHREGRAATEGRDSHRTRHVLLVSQVAVALVLLIGAGLMARAFQTLRAIDPGFRDPDTVQTFQLTIPAPADAAATDDDAARERILQMQQAVADRLAAIPGVEAAGFSSSNDGLPLDGDGRSATIFIEGKTVDANEADSMEILAASPGFFETLQTPLVAGRRFDRNDVVRRGVVLVSENLARSEWGSPAAALGKRLTMAPDEGPWFEVVGVMKDMPQQSLTATPETVIFPPVVWNATASFVIRADQAGTAGFMGEVRKALWSVNAALAPASVQTLGETYRHSMARTSMMLLILAITGAVALLLGLVGVYGIVSYAVAQRRREIGIRLALGAAQGEVRLQFVRQALILVAIGVAVGLVAATGLTRYMTSQLFGISPLDLPTHATVALVLLVTAGLASFVSAYRAAALDPIEVLRG